jgi:hypothetical protein
LFCANSGPARILVECHESVESAQGACGVFCLPVVE